MDVNQIIESGNAIHTSIWEGLAILRWSWLIVFLFSAVLTFLVGGLTLAGSDSENEDRNVVIAASITLFICMFLGMWMMADDGQDIVQGRKVEEWKNTVVYPYVQSLPVQKGEAVFLKVESQIEYRYQNWQGRWLMRQQLTPLTTSFKRGDGVITLTSWYEANMSLTKEVLPYVEYQYLDTQLPHGVNTGVYYPKVYLPEGYKFTDIK